MERTITTGETRELFSHDGHIVPLDLSSDGKTLLYHVMGTLYFRRIDASSEQSRPQLFLKLQSPIRHARFSPDGNWVVYTEGGDKTRIHAQPFPSGGVRTEISSDQGTDAVWRGDGKEIIYRWDSRIFSVRVETRARELKAAEPEALFSIKSFPAVVSSEITGISKDGSRIFFAQSTDESSPPTVYVKTSWTNSGR